MRKEKKQFSVATEEYIEMLLGIKKRVKDAQIKAVLSANKELVRLYWDVGKTILERQNEYGWGAKIIDQIAKDLKSAFPGISGFSRTNIFRMRAFYEAYKKVPQAVGQIEELPFFQIPWGHNVLLLERLKSEEERLWYASKAIEYGWSRSILGSWIKSDLYSREGKAVTNFRQTLSSPNSDMAQQSLKDPYLFDFLTLDKGYRERDVEQGLMNHIEKFLLELGEGFAFVGRQYHLVVGGSDYYLDLLFYHIKLRCYVVIELKAAEFIPEHAGKLNFYLSAVDDLLRREGDNPTIGLLLCAEKERFKAEYALRDINKPMGVAEYETKLVESLPKNFKGSLPTVKEIEAELKKQKIINELEEEGETCE